MNKTTEYNISTYAAGLTYDMVKAILDYNMSAFRQAWVEDGTVKFEAVADDTGFHLTVSFKKLLGCVPMKNANDIFVIKHGDTDKYKNPDLEDINAKDWIVFKPATLYKRISWFNRAADEQPDVVTGLTFHKAADFLRSFKNEGSCCNGWIAYRACQEWQGTMYVHDTHVYTSKYLEVYDGKITYADLSIKKCPGEDNYAEYLHKEDYLASDWVVQRLTGKDLNPQCYFPY